jgi:hypothetical protein
MVYVECGLDCPYAFWSHVRAFLFHPSRVRAMTSTGKDAKQE